MKEAREELEVIQERIHNYVEYGYASHLEPVVDALIECKNRLETILKEEKKKSYYDRCYEMKKEVVGKIQEILAEREEVEIDGGYDVVVTDHHCGEAWQASMTKMNTFGIEAGGEEFSLMDVELSDLCAILDHLVEGYW